MVLCSYQMTLKQISGLVSSMTVDFDVEKKLGRRVSNQYSCNVPKKCNEGLQQDSGDRSG